MEQMKLFEDMPPEGYPKHEKRKGGNTCNNCKFAIPYQNGGKVFWYCSKQRSNRTECKMKKIKARDAACTLFKLVE